MAALRACLALLATSGATAFAVSITFATPPSTVLAGISEVSLAKSEAADNNAWATGVAAICRVSNG